MHKGREAEDVVNSIAESTRVWPPHRIQDAGLMLRSQVIPLAPLGLF